MCSCVCVFLDLSWAQVFSEHSGTMIEGDTVGADGAGVGASFVTTNLENRAWQQL